MKPFTTLTVFILILITLAHILRLIFAWHITIDDIVIPLWVSVVAGLVTGTLAVMVWKEHRR
jgi:uncharacterized membrane protein